MSRRSRRRGSDTPGLAPNDSLPVDGSWRIVEGENESFDTTILPNSMLPIDGDADDVLVPLSSGQPSSGFPSQLSASSQASASFAAASQDSIRDFVKHQDDDQVILREPFRPSMTVSRSSGVSYRTPEPQFRMPMLDVDGGGSSGSARTVRPSALGISHGGENGGSLRRQRKPLPQSPSKSRIRRRKRSSLDDGNAETEHGFKDDLLATLRAIPRQLLTFLPTTLLTLLLWIGEVICISLHYAKYPLGALLAAYLVLGSLIIVQNMATRSIYAAVSPVCRIPGISLLSLPFCPANTVSFLNGTVADGGRRNVEFDDLMGVQSKFEQVLERSVDGVSLPFEMKRSETAVRDLRSLVRHSDIQSKHELVLEFDGYIDSARRAASDLQKFNTHVGSAVDTVISINRWTSRYIDSLSPESLEGPPSALSECERAILDKYIEHTALVSDRITALILEAQHILRLLTKAEDHLSLIYDISSRSSSAISSRRGEILWTMWTLIGANSKRLHSLAQQLDLLRQVEKQRSTAVEQVSALILELEGIQAGLGDLRESVAEPQLVGMAGVAHIPLSVHIETIDRGVERLQHARARLRIAEDERVRDAVARGGLKDGEERLLDARRP
ncbi:uncharacterized protein DCS_03762 [Drechmeria coniospora]|uniref:Uncharacterized protein n=1 Tax=Drechmeria coniospora TaxID=98403 RepID=A0A151GI38_DRECN|nr:uncharacterized protein DCS_03762 [Drechmeria coniospora]KYK56756.1 uncharacterized protein DCS_03762 [Drechmeria coniospora]